MMTHIEINKIYEREEIQRDSSGAPIKLPGKYEGDGLTPLKLKETVVTTDREGIKINNIKSFRPWRKKKSPQWDKIKGEVTVIYMEGEERRDYDGENVHCTILILESYDSFSNRMNAIRAKKGTEDGATKKTEISNTL